MPLNLYSRVLTVLERVRARHEHQDDGAPIENITSALAKLSSELNWVDQLDSALDHLHDFMRYYDDHERRTYALYAWIQAPKNVADSLIHAEFKGLFTIFEDFRRLLTQHDERLPHVAARILTEFDGLMGEVAHEVLQERMREVACEQAPTPQIQEAQNQQAQSLQTNTDQPAERPSTSVSASTTTSVATSSSEFSTTDTSTSSTSESDIASVQQTTPIKRRATSMAPGTQQSPLSAKRPRREAQLPQVQVRVPAASSVNAIPEAQQSSSTFDGIPSRLRRIAQFDLPVAIRAQPKSLTLPQCLRCFMLAKSSCQIPQGRRCCTGCKVDHRRCVKVPKPLMRAVNLALFARSIDDATAEEYAESVIERITQYCEDFKDPDMIEGQRSDDKHCHSRGIGPPQCAIPANIAVDGDYEKAIFSKVADKKRRVELCGSLLLDCVVWPADSSSADGTVEPA